MNILGLIPARGGSKGVPNKNIRSLGGKPLIAWTIEQAQKSIFINNEIYVTTDDLKIKTVAEAYGAKIVDRPKELAEDDSPTVDCIIHALKTLNHKRYDYVCLLQPTSPLRNWINIDCACLLAINNDTVVSVSENREYPFLISKNIIGKWSTPSAILNYLPRQAIKPKWFINGAVYVIKTSTILKKNTIYTRNLIPYFMTPSESYQIDTEDDLDFINYLINKSKSEVQSVYPTTTMSDFVNHFGEIRCD